jgi:ABC-type Na+ transport system ATPase subunit NatA
LRAKRSNLAAKRHEWGRRDPGDPRGRGLQALPFLAAVDRLDLSVHRGEVFCLFGPNGSGKTTFLRMLAGYISPSAGRISVAGHDVVRDGLAARRKIGYVPETVPPWKSMAAKGPWSRRARILRS